MLPQQQYQWQKRVDGRARIGPLALRPLNSLAVAALIAVACQTSPPAAQSGTAASDENAAPVLTSLPLASAKTAEPALSLTPVAPSATPPATPAPTALATAIPTAVVPLTPTPTAIRRSGPLAVGATAFDWFAQRAWGNPKAPWQAPDPVRALAVNGFGWMEARVTTKSTPELESVPKPGSAWRDEFWCSREYAMQVLRAGAAEGMRLHALLFLSDGDAHAGKQKAPAGWESFSLEETAAALRQHAFDTAKYFRERGLNIELYSPSNEIEFGVTGFSFDSRLKTAGIDVFRDFRWLRANIWDKEAVLLKAVIAGIHDVQPDAKIALHVSVPAYPDLVRAFYQAMVDLGVPFDYASFSDYPWLNYHPENPIPADYLERSVRAVSDLGKLSLIGEFSFPSGQVPAAPVVPQAGYPFDEAGQAAWVRGYLDRLSRMPTVVGAYYFYPDNFLADHGAAALFRDARTLKPALAAFAEFQRVNR